MDKAIINPEADYDLAEILDLVIQRYREKTEETIMDTCRGQCEEESYKFIVWFETHEPGIFNNIDEDINIRGGYFTVEDPIELPLDMTDVRRDQDAEEYFMEYMNYDLPQDPQELSQEIWDYFYDMQDEEEFLKRIFDSFFDQEHLWVQVGDIIIDFTWEQFKPAIPNTNEMIDRYNT